MTRNLPAKTSGVLFTCILLAWPFFKTLSVPSGTFTQQPQQLRDGAALFEWSFVLAFFSAPALYYMIITVFLLDNDHDLDMLGHAGLIFPSCHAVLTTFSYSFQFALVPNFVHKQPDLSELFYLYSSGSVSCFINPFRKVRYEIILHAAEYPDSLCCYPCGAH